MGTEGSQVGSGLGMAAGTAVGGPIGGAIGGVAGGMLGGMFDSKDRLPTLDPNDPRYGLQGNGASQGMTNLGNNAMGLGASVSLSRAGAPNYANAYGARSAAMGYEPQEGASLARMNAMANGTGPSAARQQLSAGLDQSLQQQAAVAAGARGGGANIAAAARNAGVQAANLSSQTNQAAGLARAQEQMSAIQQYQDALVHRRAANLQQQGLDVDAAYKQASLETQYRMQGRDLQLKYAQLQAQYEQQGLSAMEATQRAQLDIAKINQGAGMAQMGQDRGDRAQLANSIMAGASALGANYATTAGNKIGNVSDTGYAKSYGDQMGDFYANGGR